MYSSKNLISLLVLISLFSGLHAQKKHTLSGTVLDKETGEPVPLVTVFLPFTTIGTITDEQGFFELKKVPEGTVEVGFRHLSYQPEKLVLSVTRENIPELTMELEKMVLQMREVVKIAEEAPYLKAMRLFRKFFLGDQNEKIVRILNPEVVYFHYEGNNLIAQAKEPLHIVNRDLGYELTYFLDYFEFHSNLSGNSGADLQYYTCSGEALFSEVEPRNHRELQRFELNRDRLFSGSQRDFFQALYHNRVEQEGYQVKLAWKRYAEIEEFYRENGLELTAKPAVIDSVYDYLPGNAKPQPYYYFVMGEPLPLKSLFKLEENTLIFKMYEPMLVMYNSWYDQYQPGEPRTALVRLNSGFVTIDSTGFHKVQNGALEWKYLESGVYVRNYLPLDFFPKTEDQ